MVYCVLHWASHGGKLAPPRFLFPSLDGCCSIRRGGGSHIGTTVREDAPAWIETVKTYHAALAGCFPQSWRGGYLVSVQNRAAPHCQKYSGLRGGFRTGERAE
eukprot:5343575-Amphidinium_carterae.1